MTDTTNTVTLTPFEFEATKAKLDKINARAAKKGFTGRLTLSAEKVITTRELAIGLTVEEVRYECSITGEAPKYNGWTFLARIDAIDEKAGTFTLAMAPGAEGLVDRDAIKLNHCDHCSSKRQRKATYLVRDEAGVTKQVGSTCIKDFLGWSGSFSWLSTEDAAEELFGGPRDWERPSYTVSTVVAAAYVAIKEFGWVPSSDDRVTTKAHLIAILSDRYFDARDRAKYEPLKAHVAEALDRVPAMLQWIASLDDSSEFNKNLKACAAADEVGFKQIGLLAYVPQGFAKSQQQAAEKKAMAETPSNFIGQVGDKVTIEGTIKGVRHINGDYGCTTLYTILTQAGLVKWFSSSAALGEDVDVAVKLKGTVKKHETFNNVKSTVLTRCRELV